MTSDAFLNLLSSALLTIMGSILWVIWSEIKALRRFKHGANNNLQWLNFNVGELTGKAYRRSDTPEE